MHYDVSRQLKIFLLLSGKKYDLDFKTPGKSGQDFKTGEDMLELYTKLCTGKSSALLIIYSLLLKLWKATLI